MSPDRISVSPSSSDIGDQNLHKVIGHGFVIFCGRLLPPWARKHQDPKPTGPYLDKAGDVALPDHNQIEAEERLSR